MSEADVALYQVFRTRIQMYGVPPTDMAFTQLVVNARKDYGLKLPDAIIAATAIANELTVLTADEHFRKTKSPWKAQFFTVDAGI